jgi:tetratricopeptide (TPR) repeat protein
MKESPELQALRSAYQEGRAGNKDIPEWKALQGEAIYRKHTGDVGGAIAALVQALDLMRTIPALSRETATNLNYLADLYLTRNAIDEAEKAIREAIELSRPHFPGLLADNLWILAGIQRRQGRHPEAFTSADEARRLYREHGHSHGVAQAEDLIERIKTNSRHASDGDPSAAP